jgi:putative PIN family toxin of toxin-antitoxin system
MPECRCVLDTNRLISRLLLPGGAAARAVDHALASGVPLGWDDTLAELAQVLSRPKFDRWVLLAERQQFVRLLSGVARRVVITHRVQACRDPRDDQFLHVALNGEAEAIVTGDRDLLVLDPFHGVRILSPSGFLGIG